MSIPRKPFYYSPDEFEDFGYLGEHQLHFHAWLEQDDFDRISVLICHVWVELPQECGPKLVIDLTRIAHSDRERRLKYEDEIRRDYLSKRDADLDRTGA